METHLGPYPLLLRDQGERPLLAGFKQDRLLPYVELRAALVVQPWTWIVALSGCFMVSEKFLAIYCRFFADVKMA